MNKERGMKFWKTTLPMAFVCVALAPTGAFGDELRRDVAAALKVIRPADGYEYTRVLSSKEFAGRLTGHEGYTAAARWAAERFRAWSLKPISPKDGYLQAYPSPYTLVDKAEMVLYLPGKPGDMKEPPFREVKLVPEKEFLPLLFSDKGDRTAELVFVGWGISAPELNYDDYAGIDVRNKFVLCFRGTPDDARKEIQHYDEHRTRMATARDKGALGVIYIYPETASNPNGDRLEGFTPAQITEKVADLILEETGGNASDLKKALATYKRPISFPLRSKARLAVASRTFPGGVGYNVVGYVEGSDPRLRKECLVIGGHFDHNGTHMGLFFPGADDNASGSAAILQIAGAFAALGRKPKRSVVFVLFGGEEMGLQGSTYFAAHTPGPFTKVDAMFNFDMVGEGDGIGTGISAEPPELGKALEAADVRLGVLRSTRVMRGVGVRSSDFAPFFAAGIPCISFHSNGPHLAYHQTGDSIYRINPDIIADTARLAFLAAFLWADR
jgi:hypothetical protein